MALYFIMNIKTKLVIIVLLFYSIISTCVLFIFLKSRKNLNEYTESITEKYEIIADFVTNDFCLDFTTNMSHIITNKNVFIYRFSDDMCKSCIYEDLTLLRQFQSEVGYEKVLLLPAYREDRNSKIRLSNELKGFQYKNISDKVITFPIDKQINIKNRYMAYINCNGNIEMFFMPIKGEVELTKRYLSKIKENFFLNK